MNPLISGSIIPRKSSEMDNLKEKGGPSCGDELTTGLSSIGDWDKDDLMPAEIVSVLIEDSPHPPEGSWERPGRRKPNQIH